ncbi:MAG: hypothetical protein WAM69_17840, partial [Candidatus Sulfotelmatobacter sp.]
STDGGSSFQNYAWTTRLFDAGGVFFGDYSGIAASGGRVYGVWTEEPAVVPEAGNQLAPKPGTAPPKPRGTVVKVGVADFEPSAAR